MSRVAAFDSSGSMENRHSRTPNAWSTKSLTPAVGREAQHYLQLRTLDRETARHKFVLPCNIFVMLLHYWISFVAMDEDYRYDKSQEKGEEVKKVNWCCNKRVEGKEIRKVSWKNWCSYVLLWFGLPTIALLLVTSLQIYFLNAIWWVKEDEGVCHGEEMTCDLWGGIRMCAIAAFTLSIWPEFVESARMVTWLRFSNNKVGPDGDESKQHTLSPWMRGYCYIYSILKMWYEILFLHRGVKFLLQSDKNEDVILNTVALAFIAELDELAFKAIASEVIERDIEENMAVTIDFPSEGDDNSRSVWSFVFFNFVLRGLKLVVVIAIMLFYTHVDVIAWQESS